MYYVNYSANNGATYTRNAYEFVNKREALKFALESIKAEHFLEIGNVSNFCVEDADGRTVYGGSLYDKSRRVRYNVKNYDRWPFN